MKLNLKDRVLILNSVLPPHDSRRGIELKNSIGKKIKLSLEESEVIVLTNIGNDQYELSFKPNELIDHREEKFFPLTHEELMYLKEKVDFIDRDGRFTDFTLQTYSKIADEPLQEPVKEVVETENPTEEPVPENTDQAVIEEDEETFAH